VRRALALAAALLPAAGLTFVFRFGVAVTIAAGPALPDTDALLAALRMERLRRTGTL